MERMMSCGVCVREYCEIVIKIRGSLDDFRHDEGIQPFTFR